MEFKTLLRNLAIAFVVVLFILCIIDFFLKFADRTFNAVIISIAFAFVVLVGGYVVLGADLDFSKVGEDLKGAAADVAQKFAKPQ